MKELDYIKVTNKASLQIAAEALRNVLIIDGINIDKEKLLSVRGLVCQMLHQTFESIEVKDENTKDNKA